MASTVTDAVSLKLLVDSNQRVWYVDGEQSPVNSRLGVEEFLQQAVCKDAESIRIIGAAGNAKLIELLSSRTKPVPLEVASPLACPSAQERQDPEQVLYYMRKFEFPPCLGGWHRVTETDLTSYKLAAELSPCPLTSKVTPRARLLFEQHVASTPLTFIRTLDIDAACRLIAILIDPRWFIDINNPDSISKFEGYLGLYPTPMADAVRGRLHDIKSKRCRLVLKAWQWQAVADEMTFESNVMTDQEMIGQPPGDFLWRVFGRYGGREKGALRACSAFAYFLRNTWLNAIYANSSQVDSLFEPRHFFKSPEEVAAYKLHLELGA